MGGSVNIFGEFQVGSPPPPHHTLLGGVGCLAGWVGQVNPTVFVLQEYGVFVAMPECPCGKCVSDNPNAHPEHINSLFHSAYFKR